MHVFRKYLIITINVISRKIISTRAKPGDFKPKKINVQIKLLSKCAVIKKYIQYACWPLFFLIKSIMESVIMIYSIDQTGPNTQSGGDRKGLFNSLYHSFIFILYKGDSDLLSVVNKKAISCCLKIAWIILFYPSWPFRLPHYLS
jgi:hypothetical protein